MGLIGFYLVLFVVRNAPLQGDLRTYLVAARAALTGHNPYDAARLHALAGREILPFVYPPVALLPFILLVPLPAQAAAVVWIGLKAALLAGLVWAWWRWWTPRGGLLPLALLAVFGWNGSALWDLRAGNVALVEAGLLWAAFGCFAAGRRTAFALLVVAAACFKLAPAAFLLLLLVPAGRTGPSPWRLIGALAALAALVGLPLAVGPAARGEGFLRHLPSADLLGEPNPSGLGLATVVARAFGLAEPLAARVAAVAWAGFAATVLALSVPLLRRAWRARDPRRWVMAAAFLYVLLSPRPMAYGFVLLAPAALVLAPAPFDRPVGRLVVALALAAQGLVRASNHGSDSLLFVYAPFLLTACFWLLVLHADGRPATPREAGAAGAEEAAAA